MTRKELAELEDGTVLYNGHTEGVVKTVDKTKVIEVLIPIPYMSNESRHFDERPDSWSVM